MTTLSFESVNGGDSGNGQLLRDIEEISKALYLPKPSQRTSISSINAEPESPLKSLPSLALNFNDNEEKIYREKKKSSAWPWKPLRALSHIRQRKFNCCFFCHVHHIENLPPNFDGLDMCVHWKRKNELVSTLVSRVCNGSVQFEDTLMNRCSVYASRTGHGNFVKYEPKHFLLYTDVVGLKGVDLGKHWIDLTRILPLVFEELDEDKCSGKWTTSFKLGKTAKGATLHVSFGFIVNNSMSSPLLFDLKQTANSGIENGNGILRRTASVPSSFDCGSSSSSHCSDVKVVHQVWPNPMWEFSGSIDILYRKLDEDIMDASKNFDSEIGSNPDCDTGNEFVDDDNDAEFTVTERGIELEWPMGDQLKSEDSAANNEVEELDNDVWNLFISESSNMINSLSLDSVMKEVTDDFCKLVGETNDQYSSSQSSENGSPREFLLREFEKDEMNFSSFFYDSDTQQEDNEFSVNVVPTIHTAMADLIANAKPNNLESLETQSLMQKWGFDEESFLNSPDSTAGGFGSPIYVQPDEPAELPSLGDGLGSVLELNDGGFLRSMSPSLFLDSKNGGSLIIQVSKPTVLPAVMGTELLEVLQGMAFRGVEVLTKQVHELMPLADLSGKIIQTLACSEEMNGRDEMYVKLESGFQDISIKDLIPLVMDSIESLSIEGLRIQSGMSDSSPPSNIVMKPGNGEITESLMDLCLPLDEWLRLNSGALSDRDNLVIGLRVQLRDPLRDFESVGAPMIILIQVRRDLDNSDVRFMLEEVHLAGLAMELGKEQIWSSKRQQQSGYRWLIANNMENRKKVKISKSNAIITSRVIKKKQTANILWSISHQSKKSGECQNEDFYVRNPDVVFS